MKKNRTQMTLKLQICADKICVNLLHLCYLCAIIVSTTGCSKGQLEPDQYMKYIENENHGLKVTKAIGQFEFELQYKPLDYVVLLEKRSKLTDAHLQKRKNELDGMQYYTFKIKALDETRDILKSGISEENEYYQRLEYFTSYIQDDLSLVESGDTLPCLLFHFERNYGLAPYSTMVLGFENSGKQNQGEQLPDKTLIYYDPILGTGKVALTIKGKDIVVCPRLDLN